MFVAAGHQVTPASPDGGQPPLDPKSDDESAQTEATRRFKDASVAQQELAHTHRLSEIDPGSFETGFYPGGHGVLWDLPNDRDNVRILHHFIQHDLPLAAVCHAPATFRDAVGTEGAPLVSGRQVTGFTNTEEEGVQLTEVVPFLVRDGRLVAGQNPASSAPAAQQLLDVLAGR